MGRKERRAVDRTSKKKVDQLRAISKADDLILRRDGVVYKFAMDIIVEAVSRSGFMGPVRTKEFWTHVREVEEDKGIGHRRVPYEGPEEN